MYKNELDNLIKSDSLPKSLLLYGEEFYTNYYIKKIFPSITDKDNIFAFYHDEYDFSVAKNFLSQPSLFGDINLLYIKTDKKIPKKELDSLVELSKKIASSYFYLEFVGEDRVAKDLTKSFGKKKGADFVRFFKPNLGESIAIISNLAKEKSLQIDNYAIRELLNTHNNNLSLCVNELDKLKLLDKTITSTDIKKYIFGVGEVAMDEFIVELLQKKDIKKELEAILEASNNEEIRIINAIQSYLTMLLEFHLYIKAYGSYDTKEIVGYALPQFIAKQRAGLSIKITPKQYEDMLKNLLESEYQLKTSKNIEKNSFLYATLIKLQSFL